MAGRIHAIGVEMRMFPLLLVRIRSRVFRADIRFSFDEGDDSLVRHVFERGGLVDRTIKCFKVFEITIDFFFFFRFLFKIARGRTLDISRDDSFSSCIRRKVLL